MVRGTTPINEFDVDVDLTEATIYITYKQRGSIIVERTNDTLEVTPEKITLQLTQSETLIFRENENVEIQIRAIFPNGDAIASNIMHTTAERILKNGEIFYG